MNGRISARMKPGKFDAVEIEANHMVTIRFHEVTDEEPDGIWRGAIHMPKKDAREFALALLANLIKER